MEYVKKCMCWDCQERRDNGFMSHPGHDDRVSGSRDDLIRLVVGMQWREAVAFHHPRVDRGVFVVGDLAARLAGDIVDMRPACDIVDEWLGVRK